TQRAQVSGAGSGLVAYYNFDDVNNIGADSAGSNTGTAMNGASQTTGKVGSGALNLDGVNDYVKMNSITSLKKAGAITVSAWVKPNVKWSTICSSCIRPYIQSGREFGIGALWDGGNTSRLYFGYDTIDFTSVSEPQVGSWTHIAFTYDANTNTVIYYKNGIASSPKTYNGSLIPDLGSIFEVGRDPIDGGYFNGSIDEVRLYNRALSASEVLDLYNFSGQQIIQL
ncbi:LamG domain-containing protein, partial [bacterium]|nr:LamG domain-containing protein [bacterium]